MKNYKELLVWQKAMDLAAEVYKVVQMLPKEELYAMSSQLRRASVSIPSNIAEGNARNSTKEYIQFLSIARGSNSEVETQLLLCQRLCLLRESEIMPALALCEEIGKMLNALIKRLGIRD